MSEKLYIGNLSYKATEDDLKKKFEEIGECVSVNIVFDRFTARPKGFAFVEMATKEAAQEAIQKLNHTALYGRGIIVSEARPQGEQKPRFRGRGRF